MKFTSWLQKFPNKLTPAPFRLMQIGSAFWQSRALYVLTQLDIAMVLGDERMSVDEISTLVSAQPDPTYCLLRMLAAIGIFEESSPREFCNNKLSSYLRRDHPKNVRAQVIQDAKQYWAGHADSAVLDRMQFQAGNVLESLPAANSDKDIYLLSAVLHCFDDDTCVKALNNLAKACGNKGSRIAVMEVVIAGSKADLVSTTFDMQMFMGTRGRERSLDDWNELFDRSGVLLEEVVSLKSFGKIIVLQPKQ